MDMGSVDFGVQIEPQYGFTYEHIREVASEAERLGFESIWVSDHFFMTDDSLDVNCLECLARMNRHWMIPMPMDCWSIRNTPAQQNSVAGRFRLFYFPDIMPKSPNGGVNNRFYERISAVRTL